MVRRPVKSVAFTLVVLCVSCASNSPAKPPPADAFYFPSGIVHTDVPGTDGGVIYVASSNFDRRFDFGSVLPVAIDKIEGLPPFGKGVPDGGPASITVLPPANPVFIASFAGEMEKVA